MKGYEIWYLIESVSEGFTTYSCYYREVAVVEMLVQTYNVYVSAGADSPPKFTIGPTTAIITTTGEPFNASVTAEYELIVSASDGMNTGNGNVMVKLDGTCEDQQDGGNGASTSFLAVPAMIMHVFAIRLQ